MNFQGKKYVVYCAVPRTGSTSLQRMFEAGNIGCVATPRNYNCEKILITSSMQHLKDTMPEVYDDCFVIVSVRNPYDRFESAVRYKCSKSVTQAIKENVSWPAEFKWPYNPPKKEMTHEVRSQVDVFNHLWVPISRFLEADGEVKFDAVIRMEHYASDVNHVLNEVLELGFPVSERLPVFAATRKTAPHYWLSTERKVIDERFSRDFDLFEYETMKSV